MALANTVEGNELWLRCPYCGDSQRNLRKAHFSVNLMTGAYHCFRCNTSGRYTSREVFNLAGDLHLDLSELPDAPDIENAPPILIPGAGSSRLSALPRFHHTTWDPDHERIDTWDDFELWNSRGTERAGILSRLGKKARIHGNRGYGWSSENPRLSDPDNPLRFVEGPYDVLDDDEIMVSGTLSPWKIAQDFKSHFIILTPDGDVWESKGLRRTFLYGLKRVLEQGVVSVVGVELIPDGKDPDQVAPEDRIFISQEELSALVERNGGRSNNRSGILRNSQQLRRVF